MKRFLTRPLFAGFTLPEMLVSIIVFVFVMTLAFNTLLASTAIRQAAVARIDVYQNGRTTLDLISRELRNATLRQTDVRFDPTLEIQPGITTSSTNIRGRFILNDWPPPKDRASSLGVDPSDSRIYRGNGLDDDVDGQTDEEAFDGLDNDGDSRGPDTKEGSDGPSHPTIRDAQGQPAAMADGLDNDGNGLVDEGIDEDIFYPRDMVNFLALIDVGNGTELQEVGYAIDTRTARDLLRRASFKIPSDELEAAGVTPDPRAQVDGLYPVAINYANGVLDPDPNDPSGNLLVPWFDPVG